MVRPLSKPPSLNLLRLHTAENFNAVPPLTYQSSIQHHIVYVLVHQPILIRVRNRMGELEPWIDENFVRSVWVNMGEQVNVKMIRDKFSG